MVEIAPDSRHARAWWISKKGEVLSSFFRSWSSLVHLPRTENETEIEFWTKKGLPGDPCMERGGEFVAGAAVLVHEVLYHDHIEH